MPPILFLNVSNFHGPISSAAAQEFHRPPLWRLCLDSQLWTSTYRQSHWEESRDRRVRTMVRSWDSNGISMEKPPRGLKRATFLGNLHIYIHTYIYIHTTFFEGYHRCFSTQKWGMDSQTGNLNYQVWIHPANYKLNLETNPWMKKAGSSCWDDKPWWRAGELWCVSYFHRWIYHPRN